MPKSKKNLHKKNSKKNRKSKKQMKGGDFTPNEIQQLQGQGFTQYQIQSLDELGVSLNQVMQKINNIINENPEGFHGNSDDLNEQVMIELLNELIFDNPNAQQLNLDEVIPQGENNQHVFDHDSETEGKTDSEQDSDNEFDEEFGGKRNKKRKTYKNKKLSKKTKKTRKNINRRQKGGVCYGNGVGANTYDPNYSIYNTNLLKLFPYKP
jgi:hypothetical protein